MAVRYTTAGITLILAFTVFSAVAGCGGNSNGIRVQNLGTDDARRALSNLEIDLPDGFEAQDFTSTAYFSGQPGYGGRFDGPDPVEMVAQDFNQLNPDTALREVPCGSVSQSGSWRSLGFYCAEGAFSAHLRRPNGNEISIALQSSEAGTQLFVAVSGT